MPVTTTQAKWVGGVLTFDSAAVNCDDGLQIGGVAMSGAVRAGTHTVTTAEDTAGTLDIATGLTTVSAHFAQVLRSGAVATSDAAVSESSGTITVADGSTFAATDGDVIHWIAVGS